MNLITYSPDNIWQKKHHDQRAFLHINTKTGLFIINKSAIQLLQLSENDQLKFHQDKDTPADWYLQKTKKGGFEIRKMRGKGEYYIFSSCHLARLIFKSVNCQQHTGRVYIGENITIENHLFTTLITGKLKTIK